MIVCDNQQICIPSACLSLQPAELKNEGDSPIRWTLMTSGVKRLEDGTFRVVLPSGDPLSLPPPDFSSPGPEEGEAGYLRPQESFRFSVQCCPGEQTGRLVTIYSYRWESERKDPSSYLEHIIHAYLDY